MQGNKVKKWVAKNANFLAFRAEIKFSSWREKAKLKILHLELWLQFVCTLSKRTRILSQSKRGKSLCEYSCLLKFLHKKNSNNKKRFYIWKSYNPQIMYFWIEKFCWFWCLFFLNPNWHEAGRIYPPYNFWMGFCQLNFY